MKFLFHLPSILDRVSSEVYWILEKKLLFIFSLEPEDHVEGVDTWFTYNKHFQDYNVRYPKKYLNI